MSIANFFERFRSRDKPQTGALYACVMEPAGKT